MRGRIRALDEDLEAGRLDLFYAVYARFQQRRAERLRAALAWLEAYPEGFEPNGDQSLETDPDKLERPRDEAGLRALWRKLVLNDVLNLKLADTPEPELVDTLRKRYRNQLKRLEETNADDVFEFAMAALTHAYDPHTDYFPPREAENFDIHMSLSLEGIGALLQREDDYVKVVRLIPGGPAERSRLLRPADRIVGVGQGEDGEIVNVEGWRLDDVVDLIRGPKGTVVRLNILPADSNDPARVRTIVITRDTVRLEEQAAHKELIEQRVGDTVYRIGLITLPSFYVDQEAAFLGDPNYRSSARDVARLIRELEDEGMDALIIDLRNNGGGSLEEVRVITGYFIPKGPVVQVRGSGEKPRVLNDTRPGTLWDGPLAVLVNRLSASASEIFAAAIQDWGRGVVLGERTFGKGTVQTLDRLGDGRIKYTQAMFYRVNGDSTQLRGVEPDIVFPSLFDHDDIGESALPEALPWDRIAPVIEAPPRAHRVLVEYLRGRQTERAATDPDFVYLRAQAELLAPAARRHGSAPERSQAPRPAARVRTRPARAGQPLAPEPRPRAAAGLRRAGSLAAGRRHPVPRGRVDRRGRRRPRRLAAARTAALDRAAALRARSSRDAIPPTTRAEQRLGGDLE
ncbi:MAG: hypothetical protein KatS3mg121_0797 [Gammaproteobacteria bacterium]|nr:MAG: hypothetical protein KatS3mg121_0797 [Gammaproteobacteria bacterium]